MAERMNRVVKGAEARRLLGLSRTRYSAIRLAMRREGQSGLRKHSRTVDWKQMEEWIIQHPDFDAKTVYPPRASAQSVTSSGRSLT